MTAVSGLPSAPNAVGAADMLVIDQLVSAVLSTYRTTPAALRTFLLNGASGLVVSNGTTLAAATIGAGISLNAGGTLLNTGILALTGRAITLASVARGAGSIAQPGTISLVDGLYQASVITSMNYNNGALGGSITPSASINGTPITGLSSVAVNSAGSATATGNNTISAGGTLTLALSSLVGAISDGGVITLEGTLV